MAPRKIAHSARQSEGKTSCRNSYRGTASIGLGIFEVIISWAQHKDGISKHHRDIIKAGNAISRLSLSQAVI
jgi:hypothetical protein